MQVTRGSLNPYISIVGLFSFLVMKTVGQCSESKNNSFVTLYCGYQKKIMIYKAIHGLHTNARKDCMFYNTDCTEDMMKRYDWSNCNGSSHCVKKVNKAWMPTCKDYNKYLQVDYVCEKGKMNKKKKIYS